MKCTKCESEFEEEYLCNKCIDKEIEKDREYKKTKVKILTRTTTLMMCLMLVSIATLSGTDFSQANIGQEIQEGMKEKAVKTPENLGDDIRNAI